MAPTDPNTDLTATAEAVLTGETIEDAIAAKASNRSQNLPPLRSLLVSIAITLVGMFLVGFLLTTIATESKRYRSLPTMGSMQTDKEGNQFFAAQYPSMRRFSYTTDNDIYAAETSLLKDVGIVGTGLYIYSIANALNWVLEFHASYLGGIIWIPFLVIAIGCSFFYFYFLPRNAQSRDSALFFSILFSSVHALMIILLIFFSASVSTSFAKLYSTPVLNYGGQMLGLMLPGAFVLFMTNLFYGAIVGVVLSYVTPVVHFLRKS